MPTKRETKFLFIGGIIGAVITALSTIGAAYVSSPLMQSQWEERPIIQASFGTLDKNTAGYPQQQLQFDGNNFYVNMIARNTGKSEGQVIYTITASNARVSFDKHGIFSNQVSLLFSFIPLTNASFTKPPIYVIPDSNKDNFTISLSLYPGSNQPPFQQIDPPFIPASLSFKKIGTNYILIS